MNVYTVDSGDNLYRANKAEPEDSCAETDVCRPQRTEVGFSQKMTEFIC